MNRRFCVLKYPSGETGGGWGITLDGANTEQLRDPDLGEPRVLHMGNLNKETEDLFGRIPQDCEAYPMRMHDALRVIFGPFACGWNECIRHLERRRCNTRRPFATDELIALWMEDYERLRHLAPRPLAFSLSRMLWEARHHDVIETSPERTNFVLGVALLEGFVSHLAISDDA